MMNFHAPVSYTVYGYNMQTWELYFFQVILVNSLLRLLCLLTAFENEYQELRSRNCLLETTLGKTILQVNLTIFYARDGFFLVGMENVKHDLPHAHKTCRFMFTCI